MLVQAGSLCRAALGGVHPRCQAAAPQATQQHDLPIPGHRGASLYFQTPPGPAAEHGVQQQGYHHLGPRGCGLITHISLRRLMAAALHVPAHIRQLQLARQRRSSSGQPLTGFVRRSSTHRCWSTSAALAGMVQGLWRSPCTAPLQTPTRQTPAGAGGPLSSAWQKTATESGCMVAQPPLLLP